MGQTQAPRALPAQGELTPFGASNRVLMKPTPAGYRLGQPVTATPATAPVVAAPNSTPAPANAPDISSVTPRPWSPSQGIWDLRTGRGIRDYQ